MLVAKVNCICALVTAGAIPNNSNLDTNQNQFSMFGESFGNPGEIYEKRLVRKEEELKNIVEAILRFHLGNGFRFLTIQEAAEFLDLPYEKEALKLRYVMSANALKFRGYG